MIKAQVALVQLVRFIDTIIVLYNPLCVNEHKLILVAPSCAGRLQLCDRLKRLTG